MKSWSLRIKPIELSLDEPSIDGGIVEWIECELLQETETDDPAPEHATEVVGSARVMHFALSRAGYDNGPIEEMLDADSGEALDLAPLFSQTSTWWAEGCDVSAGTLLYVSRLELPPDAVTKNVAFAVVQRLVDFFEPALTVLDSEYAPAAHWGRLGFIEGPKKGNGKRLALRNEMYEAPRVVEEEGDGFRVIAVRDREPA